MRAEADRANSAPLRFSRTHHRRLLRPPLVSLLCRLSIAPRHRFVGPAHEAPRCRRPRPRALACVFGCRFPSLRVDSFRQPSFAPPDRLDRTPLHVQILVGQVLPDLLARYVRGPHRALQVTRDEFPVPKTHQELRRDLHVTADGVADVDHLSSFAWSSAARFAVRRIQLLKLRPCRSAARIHLSISSTEARIWTRAGSGGFFGVVFRSVLLAIEPSMYRLRG